MYGLNTCHKQSISPLLLGYIFFFLFWIPLFLWKYLFTHICTLIACRFAVILEMWDTYLWRGSGEFEHGTREECALSPGHCSTATGTQFPTPTNLSHSLTRPSHAFIISNTREIVLTAHRPYSGIFLLFIPSSNVKIMWMI